MNFAFVWRRMHNKTPGDSICELENPATRKNSSLGNLVSNSLNLTGQDGILGRKARYELLRRYCRQWGSPALADSRHSYKNERQSMAIVRDIQEKPSLFQQPDLQYFSSLWKIGFRIRLHMLIYSGLSRTKSILKKSVGFGILFGEPLSLFHSVHFQADLLRTENILGKIGTRRKDVYGIGIRISSNPSGNHKFFQLPIWLIFGTNLL